jgi:biotin carboxylase
VSGETLLVLAAATYQVPLIERARAMGVRVLTADNRPENPGHALADAAFHVSTTDSEAMLDLARREKIDGVIAAATDVALPTAAFVAERLGLVAPTQKAVSILCSKPAFRAFQAREGLPCPRFRAVGPEESFSPVAGERWIMKPDRSSGSKGVRIVSDPAEAQAHLAEARRHAGGGGVLAEGFIEGAQGTIEGVLENGRVAAQLVTDRIAAPAPHTATHGHRTPPLEAAALPALIAQVEHIATVLGLESGPFDCDFVACGAEATLLEMSPRLGGNAMMPLVEAATGFELIEYAVAHALGRGPKAGGPWAPRPTAVHLLGCMNAGRLAYDEAEARRLRALPWMLGLTLDFEPGAAVAPFTDGRHRIGEVLFQAESRTVLDARAAELLARLNVRAL